MTVRARARVWPRGDGRNDAELLQRVRLRDRCGRESTRIPVSSRDRNQPDDDQGPRKERDGPARQQIGRGRPVILRFTTAAPAFRIQRRGPGHLPNITNALVPENVERLRSNYWRGARLLSFRLRSLEEIVCVDARIADVDLGRLHPDTNLDTYHERIVSGVNL